MEILKLMCIDCWVWFLSNHGRLINTILSRWQHTPFYTKEGRIFTVQVHISYYIIFNYSFIIICLIYNNLMNVSKNNSIFWMMKKIVDTLYWALSKLILYIKSGVFPRRGNAFFGFWLFGETLFWKLHDFLLEIKIVKLWNTVEKLKKRGFYTCVSFSKDLN